MLRPFSPLLHDRARHVGADRFGPLRLRAPHHRVAKRTQVRLHAAEPARALQLRPRPQPTRGPRVRLGVSLAKKIIIRPRIRPAHAIARRPPIRGQIGPHIADRPLRLRPRLGPAGEPRDQRQRVEVDPVVDHRAILPDAVLRRPCHPRVEPAVAVVGHVRPPERLAERNQPPGLHHKNIRVIDLHDMAPQPGDRIGHHRVEQRPRRRRQPLRLPQPDEAHQLRGKFHGIEIENAAVAAAPLEISKGLARRFEVLHRARPGQRRLHALRVPAEPIRFERKAK